MKKYLKLFFIALMITAVVLLALTGCKEKPASDGDKTDDPVKADGISLDITEAIAVVDESFVLSYTFDPPDSAGEVEFSSDSDAVTVDAAGKVVAAKTGEAIVKVKEKKGDKFAECKVIVGNVIVDSSATASDDNTASAGEPEGIEIPVATAGEGEQNDTIQAKPNIGGVFGSTLFATITEAVNKAKANDVVVIKKGVYDESVTIKTNLTLLGLQNPELKGINVSKAVTATLDNLLISAATFPEGGAARVYVSEGAKVSIENTVITTSSTEKPEGGYAVYAEKQCSVDIKKNTISNVRYAVYICPTDKEVNIKDNKISNADVGIGVDLRQENSELNYPTKGGVSDNEYNEVKTKTQFFHYGENYSGDFDFKDNELENAATDEGTTGGQGMLE